MGSYPKTARTAFFRNDLAFAFASRRSNRRVVWDGDGNRGVKFSGPWAQVCLLGFSKDTRVGQHQ